ncbi:unnamed protein product [Polarella glacialis]|uniref:Peptidase S59 domain-containing protein n=1 Tax=Polarella glacialis TaxID=89957 RepID=A0A813HJ15_POLGL|nr:unnamed protein product [Polarella glacialis]
MAASILSSHQTPGHETSTLRDSGAESKPWPFSTPQPYVDALGNPLPEIRGLGDLPNIKDVLPSFVTAEPSGQQRRFSADGAGFQPIPASSSASSGLGSNLDSNARQELIPMRAAPAAPQPSSGSRSAAVAAPAVIAERPTVLVAHERGAINSARGSLTDRQAGSAFTGSGSAGSSGSRAGSTVVSNSAPAEPSGGTAAVPESGGSRSSRVRQESAADKRTTRRKPSEEAAVPQVAQPVPEVAEELQAELDECLDTIKWTASCCTRESLQDLIKSSRPAPVVNDVLEAVFILLGAPETRWATLKQLLSKQPFFDKLTRLDFQRSVTKEQFRKLRDKLQDPSFDEEHIKTECVPVVPLAIWCRAIGVYLSKTKYRDGPEIRPVAGSGAAIPPPRHERRSSNSVPITVEPDLSQLTTEELRHVRDLTIARKGIGEITFHGETDCTELDFEHIVKLEIGEVLVYPGRSKPDAGYGLNKAATVTMYQCWPPSNTVQLQDTASQDEYRDRIKNMTTDKKARFIDYDCTTGVWKFGVDHF